MLRTWTPGVYVWLVIALMLVLALTGCGGHSGHGGHGGGWG